MTKWRGRWMGWLSICLLGNLGCGAGARRSAGSTVMGLGAAASVVSVHVMTGTCSRSQPASAYAEVTWSCGAPSAPTPTQGALLLTAGLTAVVFGGVLFASGGSRPAKAVTHGP